MSLTHKLIRTHNNLIEICLLSFTLEIRTVSLFLILLCMLDLFPKVEHVCIQCWFRSKVKASIEKSKKKKAARDVFDKDVIMSDNEITNDTFVLCLNLFSLIHVNPISVKRRLLRVLWVYEETHLLSRISRNFSVALTLNFAFLPWKLMVSHTQGFCSLLSVFL